MKLSDLLKDSAYKLTQFKPEKIAALVAVVTRKTGDVTYLAREVPI